MPERQHRDFLAIPDFSREELVRLFDLEGDQLTVVPVELEEAADEAGEVRPRAGHSVLRGGPALVVSRA